MNPRRNESGQAIVMVVLSIMVIFVMASFVLDAGSWFRTDRQLQATADAAALAGVQQLPADPSAAQSTAMDYANRNGGNVLASDIKIEGSNHIISVKAAKDEEGIFSRVLGISSTPISANAKARIDSPLSAKHVAPMTVFCGHPKIHNCDGNSTPDFGPGNRTEMEFDKMGAPGAFGMLNLSGGNGTPGTSEQEEWIRYGHDKYLGLGKYNSNPGAKFSSSQLQAALGDRVGTVLLFPVFRVLEGEGENATYDIIGWIGFHLEAYEIHGHNATLVGYFTEFIAQGILASTGSGIPPTFGVKTIQLIE
jgi:hypothetical protein